MDLRTLGSVGLACIASLGTAVCCLRVAHPSQRPAFEAAFAMLFSSSMILFVGVGTLVATTSFGYDAESALTLQLTGAACLMGVWMSISVSMLCAVYDITVLALPLTPTPIKGRSWSLPMLPACITHVLMGLLLAMLALVGQGVVRRPGGGGGPAPA